MHVAIRICEIVSTDGLHVRAFVLPHLLMFGLQARSPQLTVDGFAAL